MVSPGTSIPFHLFLKDKRKLHKKFLFLKTMQYNITIKLRVNTPSLQQIEINICLSFKCRNKSESSSGSVFKVFVVLKTEEHKNMSSIICIGIVSSHS